MTKHAEITYNTELMPTGFSRYYRLPPIYRFMHYVATETFEAVKLEYILAQMPERFRKSCRYAAEASDHPLCFTSFDYPRPTAYELEQYIIPFIKQYPIFSLENVYFDDENLDNLRLIAESLQDKNCHLRTLTLLINPETCKLFAEPLSNALQHENCKLYNLSINFCDNFLSDEDIILILMGLKKNNSLDTFSLSNANFSEASMQYFSDFLQDTDCTLRVIEFDCSYRPAMATKIIKALENPNCALELLRLQTEDQPTIQEMEKLLLQVLETNQTLKHFTLFPFYLNFSEPFATKIKDKLKVNTNRKTPERCKLIQEFFMEFNDAGADICNILFQYEGLSRLDWPLLNNNHPAHKQRVIKQS